MNADYIELATWTSNARIGQPICHLQISWIANPCNAFLLLWLKKTWDREKYVALKIKSPAFLWIARKYL